MPASTVDLVYFNAGGGHRSSAVALQQALLAQGGRRWQVRLVNLFEVLDPRGRFKRATGSLPEDFYNRRLARGWTLGMKQELRVLQAMIRFGHGVLVRRLQTHWQRGAPDLVVSLIPNFNRALYASLNAACPGVPYVTLLTDLADTPPRFWIERDQPQHFICGTPRAVAQARALGHAEARIHATSGMVLRPEFYAQSPVNRDLELRRRGLDPQRPVGLVLFGGHGSQAMLGIARQLAATTQLILVCGHNAALAAALQALPEASPRLILGFSTELAFYMRLADFCIGKPGPGSVSECVQLGLPVIVVDNGWTMPQERYNAEWIRANGLGIVTGSFRGIGSAVHQLLSDLPRWRANVARQHNRALFEVPALLERILLESPVVARTAAIQGHAPGDGRTALSGKGA